MVPKCGPSLPFTIDLKGDTHGGIWLGYTSTEKSIWERGGKSWDWYVKPFTMQQLDWLLLISIQCPSEGFRSIFRERSQMCRFLKKLHLP